MCLIYKKGSFKVEFFTKVLQMIFITYNGPLFIIILYIDLTFWMIDD